MENQILNTRETKTSKLKNVPSILVLPLTILFLEITLKVTARSEFVFTETAGMVLFSIGAAFLINLLCMIFNSEAANRWICFVLCEIACFSYAFMFFMNNTYKVYMDPLSILVGIGNVVSDFGGEIISTVTNGILYILLYHIPAIIVLILAITKKIVLSHKEKIIPLISLLVGLVLSVSAPFVMTVRETSREQYTTLYSFDESVRHFGLLTSLKLDAVYSAFGNPFAEITIDDAGFDDVDDFVIEEPDHESDEDDTAEQPSTGEGDDVTGDGGEGSDPEEEPEEPLVEEEIPVEYGKNVLSIDFDALISESSTQQLANIHKYVASLEPSSKNEYTGLFEGKNLILITAEAFSAEVIDEEMTPALYRMATKGIVFEDYYQPAWGGSTSTGEFSVLTGIIPVYKVASVTQTIGHNMYFTIGNQLMRENYSSGAYHNGAYTYYSRNLTHENFGYSKFIGMGNGMEKGVKERWPESDDEMFRYIMPEYIESGEKFSLYFMSVSGHCNYSTSGNSMSNKNWNVFANIDASDTIKAYYAANYEFELAMEYLLDALEEAGIADDTVIVISADHYPYGLEESASWGNSTNYLEELYGYPANSNTARDHNALIIWSGCLEDREPITVSTPVYSIDILPTLSNLFGVDYDSRLLIGRDVFSDQEPLVIWADSDWKTDKGYYESSSGVFYPADGVTVEDGYVERIKNIVKNKKSFSKAIIDYDYYALVSNKIVVESTEETDEITEND